MIKTSKIWTVRFHRYVSIGSTILVGANAAIQIWLTLNPIFHVEKVTHSLEQQVYSLDSRYQSVEHHAVTKNE
ncbi:MAG: hypothetical protein HC907_29575 [Richelia sp. SM1_7_0]|nr:hypothetical protein [Richelia sp. SM1_7_0]